jgi:hypothetical protein
MGVRVQAGSMYCMPCIVRPWNKIRQPLPVVTR